ncbi:hypothetical protein NPIL_279681 [Nephila pilipes]|uniref:Uncharacterized protein n=1 Tax=Nephila pilipes TaxID=299642 RepID=A0A8X6NN42_NEPPI|nr:hypothetical protein NPIL_279681 [Nephila pilipes]
MNSSLKTNLFHFPLEKKKTCTRIHREQKPSSSVYDKLLHERGLSKRPKFHKYLPTDSVETQSEYSKLALFESKFPLPGQFWWVPEEDAFEVGQEADRESGLHSRHLGTVVLGRIRK